MISFANGGPHSPAMRIAVKPVDYKGGELSNLSSSEFHHIIGAVFFLNTKAVALRQDTKHRFSSLNFKS